MCPGRTAGPGVEVVIGGIGHPQELPDSTAVAAAFRRSPPGRIDALNAPDPGQSPGGVAGTGRQEQPGNGTGKRGFRLGAHLAFDATAVGGLPEGTHPVLPGLATGGSEQAGLGRDEGPLRFAVLAAPAALINLNPGCRQGQGQHLAGIGRQGGRHFGLGGRRSGSEQERDGQYGKLACKREVHRILQADGVQAVSMTTSRYSPGTTRESSPATFSSCNKAMMSAASPACASPSRAANAL